MAGEKQADFLFVNKTASSASLTNYNTIDEKLLKSQVYEHVQRRRDLEEERRTRTRPRKKHKALPRGHLPVPTPPQGFPSNTARNPGRSSARPLTSRHSLRADSTAVSLSRRDSATSRLLSRGQRQYSRNVNVQSASDEVYRSQCHPPPSLTKRVPKDATTDPFNATRIPLNDKNVSIFRYFEYQMFPAVTRQDSPNFVNTLHFDARQLVDDCWGDPLQLYTLLAGACARMKCVTFHDFQEPEIPDMCELFVSWASKQREHFNKVLTSRDRDETRSLDIRTVRTLSVVYNHRSYKLLKVVHDTINSGDPTIVDQRLIQSLYFIWTMESYRRNWDAVTQIRKYVFYLCNRYVGGFSGLKPHLQKMLYFADRFHAHATDDVPLIQAPFQAPNLSLYQRNRITSAIQASGEQLMGSSLFNFSSHFSIDFMSRMEEMSQLACVLQCHWRANIATSILSNNNNNTSKSLPCSPTSILPDREWVMKSTYNLSDRLLYEKPPKSTAFSVQEFIRVALIAWLAFITVPITGIPAAPSPPQLSPQLLQNSQPAKYDVRVTVRVDSLQKQFLAYQSSTTSEAIKASPNSSTDNPAPADDSATSKLERSTTTTTTAADAHLQHLLLWAAGLGVLACGELKTNASNNRRDTLDEFSGEDIQFFRSEFVSLARRMHVTSWGGFEDTVRGFPWLTKLEQAQDWRLTRILEELELWEGEDDNKERSAVRM